MFREWGFLLGEIWVLLALAALIGLLAGWLIWGRREVVVEAAPAPIRAPGAEESRLRAALDACESGRGAASARVEELEAALSRANERHVAAERALDAARAAPVAAAVIPVAPLAAVAAPIEEAVVEMTQPDRLEAAREGGPDDLKLIKGIGPKMEALCHRLGFYHFDQIAAWTPAELAWVDANLEDFKGRATRDNWIGQARDLAAGLPPLQGGEH